MRRLRVLAALEAPTETETAQGGRLRSWAAAGTLWVGFVRRRAEEVATGSRGGSSGGARDLATPERLTETAEAEARDGVPVSRGKRLAADGIAWRVVATEPGRPGRIRISLERQL